MNPFETGPTALAPESDAGNREKRGAGVELPAVSRERSTVALEQVRAEVKELAALRAVDLGRLHQISSSGTPAELLSANESLRQLLDEYRAKYPQRSKGGQLDYALSCLILEAVGETELLEQEAALVKINETGGLYLPAAPEGGGDYWLRDERSGGVGEAELCDVVGHGLAALGPKIWLLRFLERRRAVGAPRATLFADLDHFLAAVPASFEMASLVSAEVERREGQPVLVAEAAGDVRLFIRERDKSGCWRVKVSALDGHSPLGTGLGDFTESRARTIPLATESAVYLTSDGLFDIVVGDDRRFGDIFQQFCEARADLPPADFERELYDYAQRAKAEGRAEDDITIIKVPAGEPPAP